MQHLIVVFYKLHKIIYFKIELLVKTISLENPLENKYVYDWDSQTVETFLKHSGIGPFFAGNTINLK